MYGKASICPKQNDNGCIFFSRFFASLLSRDKTVLCVSVLFSVSGLTVIPAIGPLISSDEIPRYESLLIALGTLSIVYAAVRLCIDNPALLKTLVLSLYIYTILVGYVIPAVSWLEFLFLPIILLDSAMLFSWPIYLLIGPILGSIGPLLLSSHIKAGTVIQTGHASIPLVSFLVCFYVPLTVGLILLSHVQYLRTIERERMEEIESQNRRLEAINSEINNKLFRIQQDSSYEERMRITKEIHDTAGYVFINVIMLLQAAVALLDKDRALGEEKINFALDYTRRGMNEIRHILREMRVSEKPSLGLQNELFDIAQVFMNATGFHVKLEYGNWPKTFGRDLDIFFCSFLQECLTNAVKHGNASRIEMLCWQNSQNVTIQVKDNGGVKEGPITPGIGITGIKDFAGSYNGTVELGYDQDGFTIRVSIPVEVI